MSWTRLSLVELGGEMVLELFVVATPFSDLRSAVDLLEKNQPGDLMGESEGREADEEVGAFSNGGW